MRLTSMPCAAALCALVCSPLHAQNLPDRDGVMTPPPGTAATVDESHALVINPAGLGFMEGPQAMVAHSGADFVGPTGASTSMWGGVRLLERVSLAAGMDWLRPAQQLFEAPTLSSQGPPAFPLLGRNAVRANVGGAFRFTDELSVGGAYRHLWGTRQSTYNIGSLDVGVTFRPFRWLSTGLVLEQGNSPFAGNKRVLRSLRGAVAVRPYFERFTFSYEWRVDEYLRLDTQLLARAEILPGISLMGNVFHLDLAAGSVQSVWGLYQGRTTDPTDMLNAVGPVARSSAQRIGVGLGFQVDLEHFGGGMLGTWTPGRGFLQPYNGIPDPRTGGAGTLGGLSMYGRASVERYPSMIRTGASHIVIDLQGKLGSPEPGNPVEAAAGLLLGEDSGGDVIARLDTARRDRRVKVVVLRIRSLDVGWGRIVEVRQRVEALRKAGKRVVAHMDYAGDEEYHIASAADKIYLSPGGMLALDGFSVSLQFVGAALDRVGVHVQAVAAGKYKSAPEQLTQTQPSEANKEVQRAILDGLYDVHTAALSRLRGLPVEKIRELLDRGGLSAEEAIEEKMVDGLAYADDLEEVAGKDLGMGKLSLSDSYGQDLLRRWRWAAPSAIAVVPLEGEIRQGKGGVGTGGSSAGADDVVEALRAAAEDDDIKAVVLRVESPGGDSLASDLIWNAVAQLRKKKPVIASFGDLAASGGYYAACGADLIVAEPTTLTGSIGVFALSFEVKDLLDRFGVTVWEENRGRLAGGGWWRPWTDEEKANVEKFVGLSYKTFLSRVKSGRKFSQAKVEEIAQGRVWTGRQAKEIGLVDEIGGIVDAIEFAKFRVGLAGDDTVEVRIITGKDDPVTRWSSALNVTADFFTGQKERREQLRRAAAVLLGDPNAIEHAELLTQSRTLALMPYTVTIR